MRKSKTCNQTKMGDVGYGLRIFRCGLERNHPQTLHKDLEYNVGWKTGNEAAEL